MINKDLGMVTAYAYAKAGGYTGTEAQFTELLGNIAEDLAEIENLSVTVETLPAESQATASYADGVLHLGIPKGDKGDQGKQGEIGLTPDFSIGTVETLQPDESATATITGTDEEPVLNLGIPKGIKGDPGDVNATGTYESLTAGNALQILSNASIEDTTPYTFRRSGGGLIPFDFTREELSKVVGGTVAWNQLLREMTYDYWSVSGVSSDTISDGVCSFMATTQGGGVTNKTAYRASRVANHVYLQSATIWLDSGSGDCRFRIMGGIGDINFVATTTKQTVQKVVKPSTDGEVQCAIQDRRTENFTQVNCKDVMVVDLTALFSNSAIADYIYSLETATEGSGIDKLREWGFFFDSYYAYDAGSLQSVCVSEHDTVGFNAWDEEWKNGYYNSSGVYVGNANYLCSKNLIKVLPNTAYYIKCPDARFEVLAYDANGNYIDRINNNIKNATFTTPSNCHYVAFGSYTSGTVTTYNNDICINLSDTTRNGEYQSYQKHTYALDSDLVLRGIPKLDSNNKLYYDGDEYLPSGSVGRRFAEVDLGDLEWTYNDTTYSFGYFRADVSGRQTGSNFITSKYVNSGVATPNLLDKEIGRYNSSSSYICVRDDSYTDATTFKSAMNGVKLVYEKATPTTETADSYTAIQICDSDGTEEFVDALVEAGTRDVAIPVGTETVYYEDMAGKLAELPPIPSAPSANGTYTLQAVVSSGTVTYQWTS